MTDANRSDTAKPGGETAAPSSGAESPSPHKDPMPLNLVFVRIVAWAAVGLSALGCLDACGKAWETSGTQGVASAIVFGAALIALASTNRRR